MIPLVDLKKQYRDIKPEIDRAIQDVIDTTEFIHGRFVAEFENKFASLHQIKYCAGCSNGTSAISLALEALGIGKGNEVITTPHTFIATAEAICHVGAKPIFVDIDPETYTIDVNQIEKAITPQVKAILPVHIYGNPTKMDTIIQIARKYHLKVIEDCAQAHLASFNDQLVGTFGDISTFSFYPGKNLGAYGDAGCIVSNNRQLIKKCKMLIDHGRRDKYLHDIIGYNQRMDGIQASILVAKMRHLKRWTIAKRKKAKLYDSLFRPHPNIFIPRQQTGGRHVYHLYVIQVNNRDEVMEQLKTKEISCGIHYPIPLHLQPALSFLGYRKGDFPVAEKVAQKILTLPLYPELPDEDVKLVSQEIIINAVE